MNIKQNPPNVSPEGASGRKKPVKEGGAVFLDNPARAWYNKGKKRGESMLTKNAVCRMTIQDLNNLGYGVGRMADKVVFVSGAVDGDECDVRIIRVCRDFCVGRIERLLTPSPHRIAPACAARGCGGCAYGAVTYEHELKLKREHVVQAFRKAGVAVSVGEVLHTEKILHYRNKAQYPVAAGRDGRLSIGFYAPKSHRVVEAASCPLLPTIFERLAEVVRAHAQANGVSAYDEETRTGLLRHIYLRSAVGEGEVLVTLVVTAWDYPAIGELVAALRAASPAVCGVLLNLNREDTNVVLGAEYRTLYGRPWIYDTLCGVKLKIAPAAFYQVNHDAAELLYRKASELAELRGDETLLDLYCGIGSIGLSMAGRLSRLFGVEIVPDAVTCARENAAANGIAHAVFAIGDAQDTPRLLTEAGFPSPDVVVLDPPRKGAGEALLQTVADLAPEKIVYISCNPDTLARDTVTLLSHGYRPGEVIPVDLFPRTGHVETVVLITRNI